MKKIIKKSSACVAVFALLVSLFSVSFSATTYYYSHNYEFYKNDSSGLTITQYQDTVDNLQIPSELIDIKVNEIGPSAFADRSDLLSVSMPDSIETISAFAFANCQNVENIKFSSNLSLSFTGAFQECSSLKSADMSMTKITTLSNQTFYKCTSLRNVVLPSTCTTIKKYALANCTQLENVFIPSSVTAIEANAFKNSSAFTITGYFGSYAEEYANANNIPFKGISTYDIGDVNMDGKVDILDATLVQKYAANIVDLSAEQKYLADYNNDGDITVVDATEIQKFIVHLN